MGMMGIYLGSRRNNQLLQTVDAFSGEGTWRRFSDVPVPGSRGIDRLSS